MSGESGNGNGEATSLTEEEYVRAKIADATSRAMEAQFIRHGERLAADAVVSAVVSEISLIEDEQDRARAFRCFRVARAYDRMKERLRS